MCVKFEWAFPDSVIFLPHSYLVIAVWLFCCLHPGKSDRTEDGSCRTLCGEEGKYADQ